MNPQLLDEHRSIHAYFGGMLKNPGKWISHTILGPMDPIVLFLRHQEAVVEMLERGFNHYTDILEEEVLKVKDWRDSWDLQIGDFFDKQGACHRNASLREVQVEYLKKIV